MTDEGHGQTCSYGDPHTGLACQGCAADQEAAAAREAQQGRGQTAYLHCRHCEDPCPERQSGRLHALPCPSPNECEGHEPVTDHARETCGQPNPSRGSSWCEAPLGHDDEHRDGELRWSDDARSQT